MKGATRTGNKVLYHELAKRNNEKINNRLTTQTRSLTQNQKKCRLTGTNQMNRDFKEVKVNRCESKVFSLL